MDNFISTPKPYKIINGTEKSSQELKDQNKDLLETVAACLRAAGWDGTLEELNTTGKHPSDYIREKVKQPNLRLLGALMNIYIRDYREGWEEGPSPAECQEVFAEEIENLFTHQFPSVEVVADWLKQNKEAIRKAPVLDIEGVFHNTQATAEDSNNGIK